MVFQWHRKMIRYQNKKNEGVTTKVAQDCLHIPAAYRNTLLNQHFGVSISQKMAWTLFHVVTGAIYMESQSHGSHTHTLTQTHFFP